LDRGKDAVIDGENVNNKIVAETEEKKVNAIEASMTLKKETSFRRQINFFAKVSATSVKIGDVISFELFSESPESHFHQIFTRISPVFTNYHHPLVISE